MDARLTELEVKLSFAEDQIDALNATVFRQQQDILRLQEALKVLRQQVLSAMPSEARTPQDEIPPHY